MRVPFGSGSRRVAPGAAFTVFLLVIDQLWAWLLTRETLFGGIIPKPPVKQVKQNEEKSW